MFAVLPELEGVLDARLPHQTVDDDGDLVERHRFRQIVVGPAFHRGDRDIDATECRHHHELRPAVLGPDLADEVEPEAVGQIVVDEDDIRLDAFHGRPCIRERGGMVDGAALALEERLHVAREEKLVLDDQDQRIHQAARRSITTLVPTAGVLEIASVPPKFSMIAFASTRPRPRPRCLVVK